MACVISSRELNSIVTDFCSKLRRASSSGKGGDGSDKELSRSPRNRSGAGDASQRSKGSVDENPKGEDSDEVQSGMIVLGDLDWV